MSWKAEPVQVKGLKAMQPELIGGGFALPKRFTAAATRDDVRVEIEAEVVDEHVWARVVSVSSEGRRGVTARTLREVPVRSVLGDAAVTKLLKVVAVKDGWKASPAKYDESAAAAIKKAIQYVEASKP